MLLHGNGKDPAGPTSYISCSDGSSGEIFGARLVSGYTIPGLSATSGLIAPMRDLLAPSLLLHRHNTTEGQFSLPFVEVFLCPDSTKEWIEEMDGTVAVESVVGEGSCFRIHLPKAAAKNDSKISQRPEDQETLAESTCEGL